MIAALDAEWGKTWSVRSPFLCLIGVPLVMSVTAFSLANDFVQGLSLGEHPPSERMQLVDALGPAAQFGISVFAAFAMLLITAEYQSGTIRTTFQAEPRRGVVLAGKVVIAAGIGLVTGVVTGAVGLALAGLALGDLAAPSPEPVLLTSARVGLLFAVSAILVVALGVIIRSSAGTLAAAIVLLVGTLALPTSASIWTPAGGGATFISGDDAVYPAAVGLLVNVVWTAIAVALAMWSLRSRDA